jgi:hypothetical protein
MSRSGRSATVALMPEFLYALIGVFVAAWDVWRRLWAVWPPPST